MNSLRAIRQSLWTAFRVLQGIKYRIDGFQARIIWNAGSLIFSILKVEFSILINDIQGVNNLRSVGQLIAAIVSVGAFITMVAEVISKERTKLYGFPLRIPDLSPDPST